MSLLVESLPFLHFGSSDFGVVRGILRVESNFADLSINNEEEVEILLDEIDGSEEGVPNDLCLVGRFITQQIVNFTRMKNTQTSVWRLMRGVSIKPIGEGRFLFQFYHMLDVYDLAHGYFTERVGVNWGISLVGPLSGINSILTNPIFEEDNRVKVLELGDYKGDEERKRKRGKMIMGDSYGNNSLELVAMNTDDNTVDSDTTLVMAGLVSGAYREL
ncbi:hypothetical protein ACS0TY_013949 [Phlomoides rotata]